MGQTQERSSRADAYTFGVEIECILPTAAVIRLGICIGAYHHGYPLPAPFPQGWTAERDGSIHAEYSRETTVEIVSPVMQGAAGVAQVKQVAQTLKDLGARVNSTCGFHVHIGAASVADHDEVRQAEWVAKLLYQTAMHETALYASTGTHRRENGRYARSIKGFSAQRQLADAIRKAPKERKAGRLQDGVYHAARHSVLNLTNLFSQKATVEFRYAAGTVEWVKMLGHIQTCLALAEKATEQAKLDWEGIASERTYKQAGAGTRALDRFLYLTGWTKGRRDVGKPQVEMAGWIADLADLKPVKAELKRLAQKYDQGAN
jgi:hypothetical protein